MDRKLFQLFVKENFEAIKEEIMHGVADRQDLFIKAMLWKTPFQGVSDKVLGFGSNFTLGSDGPVYSLRPGCVYEKDGVMRICLLSERREAAFGNDFCSDDDIVAVRTSSFHCTLHKLSPAEGGTMNYTYRGTRRSLLITENGKEKRSVRFDLNWTLFGVTDARVWDSILTFFQILENASKAEHAASAGRDVEDAIKRVYGLPCNPLRFINALGHQYTKYILSAFGIEAKAGEKGEYENLIAEFSKRAGQKFAWLSKEFVPLLYYHKGFRNNESHCQYMLPEDTVSRYTLDFLRDCIVLVYMLKYLLELPCECSQGGACTGLLTPVYTPVGSQTGIVCAGVAVERYEGYFPVRPFTSYTAIKESDGTESSFTVKDLDVSAWKLMPGGKGLELMADGNIELIKSAVDYAPVMGEFARKIEALGNDPAAIDSDSVRAAMIEAVRAVNPSGAEAIVDSISRESVTPQDVDMIRDAVAGVRQEVENIDRTVSSIKTQMDAMQRESRRRRNRRRMLRIALVVLAVLLAVACYLPFNNYARLHYGPVYRVAFALSGNPDMAYDRAVYLETEVVDGLDHGNAGREDIYSYEENPETLRRRLEAAHCYRDAAKTYAARIADAPERHGDDAYRLAQMYLRGKGGVIDYDKAIEYAAIASRHGHYRTGLLALLLHGEGAEGVKVDAILAGPQADGSKDAYIPLVKAVRELDKAIENGTANKAVCDTFVCKLAGLMKTPSDAMPEAILKYVETALDGIKDKTGHYIASKDFYTANDWLFLLSGRLNYLPAQILRAQILGELSSRGSFTEYIKAAYNGHTPAVVPALEEFSAFMGTEEDFKAIYPEAYSEIGKRNHILDLHTMHKAISDGDYPVALEMFHRLRSEHVGGYEVNESDSIDFLLRLQIPDSARVIRERLRTAPVRELEFAGNPDSSRIYDAVQTYVDGIYAAEGLGYVGKDDVKADSLFRVSADMGLAAGAYTLGRRLEERGLRREARAIIYDWHTVSDRARRWLSAYYRLQDPDGSMKLARAVTDTLDMYSLVRIGQDFLMRAELSDTIDGREYTALMNRLSNCADFTMMTVPDGLKHAYLSLMASLWLPFDKGASLFFRELSNRPEISAAGYGLERKFRTAYGTGFSKEPLYLPSRNIEVICNFLAQPVGNVPAFARLRKLAELRHMDLNAYNLIVEAGLVSEDDMARVEGFFLFPHEFPYPRWAELPLPDNEYTSFSELFDLTGL